MFSSVFLRPYPRAVAFMLISTAGFSAMSVGVRSIAEEMDASVIVTWRNFITLLLLLPWVLPGRGALLKTKRLGGHAWRGAVGSIGMLLWTYALTIMPLPHATALSFTAPLFATLFAILVFKEHASRTTLITLLTGFLGTLVILRPDPATFEWHSLIVIVAASAWAVTGMFVKSLSSTEPPMRMVFYMNFFMFLIALPLALVSDWQWPNLHQLLVLIGIGIASIVTHFSMARAYSLAPVSRLMPLDFSRLVYTSLFAYLLFGETSDLMTWIGAAIIITSAAANVRRSTIVEPD